MFNTIECVSYLPCDTVCRTVPTPIDTKPCHPQKNKNMEDTMNTNVNVSPTISMTDRNISGARSALSNRLCNLRHEKEDNLARTFFIYDDEAPKTKEELIARITEGKFEIAKRFQDDEVNDYDHISIWDKIEWRSVPADKVGYTAALKKLREAYKDADLIVDVCDPETKGLEAVTNFKSMSFV